MAGRGGWRCNGPYVRPILLKHGASIAPGVRRCEPALDFYTRSCLHVDNGLIDRRFAEIGLKVERRIWKKSTNKHQM